MTDSRDRRRYFVLTAGALGAGLLLDLPGRNAAQGAPRKPAAEKEVGAVEDLMREHGVLRRALLIYRESATRLRHDAGSVDPAQIAQTAQLFRDFGEVYHEKKLEEAHIFPAVRKAGGAAAAYIDVLLAQHARGREITDYILTVARRGAIGGDAESLARAFATFDLMYENHTAREDTVVFPAWKEALSARQIEEMGDRFEDIERAQFGRDGYEDAVARMDRIEQALGFADLAQFTAPPPPKA